MKKVRIGVLGGYRGTSMINFCKTSDQAEIVAICDKNEEVLQKQMEQPDREHMTFYRSFDEFLQHDMDAVVLANYANEHAPFAVRCLERGLHVYSEVVQRYPTVQIIDSNYYGEDTFMLCEVNPYVLITQQVYADIHPNLVTIPLAGDYDMPYGLMYAKSPSATARQFLEAAKKQR